MKKEQAIEKIYDLIEQFDFEELNEREKSIVLEHLSSAEYTSMRSTIADANALFTKYRVPGISVKRLTFKKLALYPVAFYKIAVAIILLMGIAFLLSKNQNASKKDLLARIDTVFIEKTDTVVLNEIETIEIIKTKFVYKDLPAGNNNLSQTENSTLALDNLRDCSIEICPDDMSVLSRIKTKGDFSKDTILTDFIVSLN